MRYIFAALFLTMLLSTALCAAQQADLEGRWFGSARIAGSEFRMLVEFEPGPDGALKEFLFSLDQGGQALLADQFELSDDFLTLEVGFAGLVIAGQLDAAAESID
jgi:hypothetical protein